MINTDVWSVWKEYWETHGKTADVPAPFFCKPLSDESLSSGQESNHAMDREELKQKIRFKYESNVARAYRESLSINAKACRSRDDPTAL